MLSHAKSFGVLEFNWGFNFLVFLMKRKVLLDTRQNKNSWLPTQNTNPETQYKAFIYIYIYISSQNR